MVKRYNKQDEPVQNGHLVKKRFDFNSYDVDISTACVGSKTSPIVGVGVVGCMKVGR